MNGLIISGLRNRTVLSVCEVIVLRRNMQDRMRIGKFGRIWRWEDKLMNSRISWVGSVKCESGIIRFVLNVNRKGRRLS